MQRPVDQGIGSGCGRDWGFPWKTRVMWGFPQRSNRGTWLLTVAVNRKTWYRRWQWADSSSDTTPARRDHRHSASWEGRNAPNELCWHSAKSLSAAQIWISACCGTDRSIPVVLGMLVPGRWPMWGSYWKDPDASGCLEMRRSLLVNVSQSVSWWNFDG